MRQVDQEYFDRIKPGYERAGYSVPKWIQFCEKMLKEGFDVAVHSSKSTESKYVYLAKEQWAFKIRFSTHKPNRGIQASGDCDYYVGIHNKGAISTEEVIHRILVLTT